MKQTIWMSYDLGLKGDYPGLYRWLDLHKAKECGNSIAYLSFSYVSDLMEDLRKELKENVELKSGDRIYLIASHKNEGKMLPQGRFLFGNRKASPWEGAAPVEDNSADI